MLLRILTKKPIKPNLKKIIKKITLKRNGSNMITKIEIINNLNMSKGNKKTITSLKLKLANIRKLIKQAIISMITDSIKNKLVVMITKNMLNLTTSNNSSIEKGTIKEEVITIEQIKSKSILQERKIMFLKVNFQIFITLFFSF